MKTLVFSIAAAVASFASLLANAGEIDKKIKGATAENIIEHYLDASVLGKPMYINSVLAEDFKLVDANGLRDNKFERKAVVEHLKKLKGINHDCKVDYRFLEKGTQYSVVKVEYKFANFTRTEYLSMAFTSDGWKIKDIAVAY